MEPDLKLRIEERRRQRGSRYVPRTKHRDDDGWALYTNRLFLESSPYLLQHAHNPVDWYPWGEEAFARARELQRPVLLSIGYATCHWCHVMEEESFEDEEIASYLNEHYVMIKVDREERPDVDTIYMNALHLMGQQGGWPLNVWLTPDRKPFYGGTYFPPRNGDRGISMGFLTVLERVREAFTNQQDRVEEAGMQLTAALQKALAPMEADGDLSLEIVNRAVGEWKQRFDAVHGGMGAAPKFPSSTPVRFLLRHYRRTGDEQALHMATHTLERMAAGGIYDHVAGGFHRYATDAAWLVPHFEKMLYDNALLVVSYLEAYQATGQESFRRLVEEILAYVARDMTSPEGGFYSATDADSATPEGESDEGFYFTWTPTELERVLGPQRSRIVQACYGVTEEGNFEGRNILHMRRTSEDVAEALGMPVIELDEELQESRRRLYEHRHTRPAPLCDEKILTSWNGLMISGFARAGAVLQWPEYIDRAKAAAQLIWDVLLVDGRLRRSYMDGVARHNAYLDDYAFLTAGLLDLFEASSESVWLDRALALDQVLEQRFEDAECGGFFMTSDDHEDLLAREKPAYDGAEPSGNSVAILNLLRLAALTTDDRYRQRAQHALEAFSGTLSTNTLALPEMLLALDFFLDRTTEIVIVVSESHDEARPMLAELGRRFIPGKVVTIVKEGDGSPAIPYLVGKGTVGGKPTAYVCEQGRCQRPIVDDPQALGRQLDEL